MLSSPSRVSLPTPEKSTPISPKAGVRPRMSSWSVQLAKLRMLLKLKSAALPRVASSVRIPSNDALASLSRSTGALTRSASVRWRPEPATTSIDTAGPKISVPVADTAGHRDNDLAQWPLCGCACRRHQADQPFRGVSRPPGDPAWARGRVDLATSQVRHQHTGALGAETDTDDVSCRAGPVQIRGPTTTTGDLVYTAVDDEAIGPKLLHCARHRGLAQARQRDDLVARQGCPGKQYI